MKKHIIWASIDLMLIAYLYLFSTTKNFVLSVTFTGIVFVFAYQLYSIGFIRARKPRKIKLNILYRFHGVTANGLLVLGEQKITRQQEQPGIWNRIDEASNLVVSRKWQEDGLYTAEGTKIGLQDLENGTLYTAIKNEKGEVILDTFTEEKYKMVG